jgi:hypothetical protein
LWALKQDGQMVVSTDASYFEVEGTVAENRPEGIFRHRGCSTAKATSVKASMTLFYRLSGGTGSGTTFIQPPGHDFT